MVDRDSFIWQDDFLSPKWGSDVGDHWQYYPSSRIFGEKAVLPLNFTLPDCTNLGPLQLQLIACTLMLPKMTLVPYLPPSCCPQKLWVPSSSCHMSNPWDPQPFAFYHFFLSDLKYTHYSKTHFLTFSYNDFYLPCRYFAYILDLWLSCSRLYYNHHCKSADNPCSFPPQLFSVNKFPD